MTEPSILSAKNSSRSKLRFDSRAILLVLIALILVYQVVVPFLMIIWTSLKTARPGDPEFVSASVTIANYVKAFGDAPFWTASRNTLMFAAASSIAAFIPGVFLAWVLDRTNIRGRHWLRAILIGRIAIPGILITVSWILLASPNIGLINQISRDLFGIRNIVNIYSFWGMVFVQAIEMVPLTYLLLSASFQSMDPRLEEAAKMCGASTWAMLRKVVLPLSLPAVVTSILLLFITTVETFEVPLLIGGRARTPVYATEIYYNTSRTPTDWGMAATYSVALLVMTVLFLAIYFRLLRSEGRYQTVSGKDFKPRQIDLGAWKPLFTTLASFLVVLITGVPLIVMLYASLLPFYQAPSVAAFESMSLTNYVDILNLEKTSVTLVNSAIVGIATASIVVLFASMVAFFVHRTTLPGRKLLDVVSFAPIAIPSVVLGTTFLWFYLLVPVPIIGTLTIIILAYFTKFIPFALRFVSNSVMQLHPELEEAAATSGASFLRCFVQITLPLIKPGLLAAWFWVMIQSFRELTVALMLARSDNRTASVLIFDLWDTGSFLKLSAFGVLMFFVLLMLSFVSYLLTRRLGIDHVG